MSGPVLWHSKCGFEHLKFTMLKNILLSAIFLWCASISGVTGDCVVQSIWKCVVNNPLDILYVAIFSVLLLWSGGWLRWIRSYYGALKQKYSVLHHCTGNTLEYLPATQLWESSTESLLRTNRREKKGIIFQHQFQCLVITSDSTQSIIRPQKIIFSEDISLWYVNSKEEAENASQKEVFLQHPS
jgi:hypothetical protein